MECAVGSLKDMFLHPPGHVSQLYQSQVTLYNLICNIIVKYRCTHEVAGSSYHVVHYQKRKNYLSIFKIIIVSVQSCTDIRYQLQDSLYVYTICTCM